MREAQMDTIGVPGNDIQWVPIVETTCQPTNLESTKVKRADAKPGGAHRMRVMVLLYPKVLTIVGKY